MPRGSQPCASQWERRWWAPVSSGRVRVDGNKLEPSPASVAAMPSTPHSRPGPAQGAQSTSQDFWGATGAGPELGAVRCQEWTQEYQWTTMNTTVSTGQREWWILHLDVKIAYLTMSEWILNWIFYWMFIELVLGLCTHSLMLHSGFTHLIQEKEELALSLSKSFSQWSLYFGLTFQILG